MESSCNNHVNGFEHLSVEELGGYYDVGVKFEEQESSQQERDPNTGLQVWGEPLLILYVSVAHPSLPERPTLRYGLTRSKFESGLRSGLGDRRRLLDMAWPHIVSDAQALTIKKIPKAATSVLML